MMETLAEIIAEMRRRPDPGYLLEWIERNGSDAKVRDAIQAYWDSIEEGE